MTNQTAATRSPLDLHTGRPTETSGLHQLFFIRRHPKLFTSRKWVRPQDPAKWEAKLKESGFIVPSEIDYFAETRGYPIDKFQGLKADVEYLLDKPVIKAEDTSFIDKLYEYDTLAKNYQNAYYLFNWVFIIGAFATTLMSVISVLATAFPQNVLISTQAAWWITVGFGALTAIYTALNSSQRPQFEWYVNRRRAEAMRRHYYLYLAHARPYNGDRTSRRRKLDEIVRQINRIGRRIGATDVEDIPATGAGDMIVEPKLTPEEVEFLIELYADRRVQKQGGWYQDREIEFRFNSQFALTLSSLLLFAATTFGAVNASDPTNAGAQLAASVLPSAAAVLAGFGQIYGWDRQRTLYRSTADSLSDATVEMGEGSTPLERAQTFIKTVIAAESVFAGESDQWGQGLIERELAAFEALTANEFSRVVDRSDLTQAQKAQIQKILGSVSTGEPAPPPAPPPPTGG
jgi:hypothetical protein